MRRALRRSVAVFAGGLAVSVVALLCAGGTAWALTPSGINTALAHYNGGTATPTEIEEVQASLDYLESYGGVSSSQLTFETIFNPATGVTNPFSADPFLVQMQAADSAVAAGGSVEQAIGGELASIETDLGIDAPEAATIGDLCADPAAIAPCVAAGAGAAIGVFIGPKLVNWLGIGSNDAVAEGTGATHVSGSTDALKVWEPVYQTTQVNGPVVAGCGTGGIGYVDDNQQGAGALNPGIPNTSGNGTGSTVPINGGTYLPVPCGPGVDPGGGYFLLWLNFTAPASFGPHGWVNLYPGSTATGPCNSPASSLSWGPPQPGNSSLTGAPEHGWWDENLGTPRTCSVGSSPNITSTPVNSGASIETASAQHATISKTSATCPSGETCKTVAVNPATSWGCNTTTVAACLANLLGQPSYAGVAQHLNAGIGATNPTTGQPFSDAGAVTVPDCAALTVAVCEGALSAAGFSSYTVSTLTNAQADLTKPAGDVVYTTPARGASVDTGTQIGIFVNPSPLPLVVPAPLPNEVFTAYQSRLSTLGLTDVVNQPVSAANENAGVGPNVVLSVSPAVGTQVAPGTEIDVQSNPPDAPAAGAAPIPGASCGLTPPSSSINFGPITGLTFGTVFPFSIIPWLQTAVGSVPGAQRPSPVLSVFGASIDVTSPLGSTFDPVFGAIRSVLTVLLWLSAAWVLYRRILGSF
jgi:hypothetical protein